MEPTILQWILIVTIINGLLAFSGGLLFLIFRKNLSKILIILVSFTTGALLGGAFFHFIPEALEELNLIKTAIFVIIGILLFYFIEKILHWHHCHDGTCKTHPFTYLILYGDAVHNFLDGLIIAAGFLISIPTGLITSLLILLHEFPQEIGDFGVLIYGGLSKTKALMYNFLSQLTAILGGVLGFFFLSEVEQLTIYLLPITAGGFLYIAFNDLLPEIIKEKSKLKTIFNIIAIILGLLILILAKVMVE